jgi:5-methylcytosine-specific restriction endonuclease McrA
MPKGSFKPEFRQSIFNKFGGKCSYCGIDLDNKFHLDHFIPKRRYNKTHKELVSIGYYPDMEKGNDKFDNLMPCCASCNSSKSDLSIEEFRVRVLERVERLNKFSGEYNIAKRFGLVKEISTQVIFYFEKFKDA